MWPLAQNVIGSWFALIGNSPTDAVHIFGGCLPALVLTLCENLWEHSMGWVVYEVDSGRMIKYYKKPGPAKSEVTRQRKFNQEMQASYGNHRMREYAACSYRDYEGQLMGLRGADFKFWQFCNTQPTT
jgi:hypothetical protein